jgi:hypothetical protein
MSKKPDLSDDGHIFTEELRDMTGSRTSPTSPPCAATDLPRWAELGLNDPPRDGRMPRNGHTADIAVWALGFPGSTDPVKGILDAVSTDMHSLSHLLEGSARRIDAALELMERADGRAETPPEHDPDAEIATEPPSQPSGEPAGG